MEEGDRTVSAKAAKCEKDLKAAAVFENEGKPWTREGGQPLESGKNNK